MNPNATPYGEPAYASEEGYGYNDPAEGGAYAEQQQYYTDEQQHQYDPSSYSEEWDQQQQLVIKEPGEYFSLPPLVPQIYNAPVSALAYDAGFDSLYVASHTLPFGERPRRASMLVTHTPGDGMLYSSCAGHPEADIGTLQRIYQRFYIASSGRAPRHATSSASSSVPPHCHQPPFGATLLNPQASHLGISEIIPSSAGYVASVSPSGVRVHTVGGLCVSDHEIFGLTCGTPHPESGSHISVGGCDSHVHCMDVYQNLRIISSHSFDTDLGVHSLIANEHQGRALLVAGCSDGTLRFVDGRMRSGQVANIKTSHVGGVSNVATCDGPLVATTGFAAKCSAGSSPFYCYPDPNVLLYDVRYLGRGGIVHAFSGLKGGPRHVAFMPSTGENNSNKLLVASGQPGGGLQIITPFEDPNENAASFLFPQLDQDEQVSCLTLAGKYVALGTSQSRVLQYELAAGHAGESGDSSSVPPYNNFPVGSTTSSFGAAAVKRLVEEKLPLIMPNYYPEPSPLFIDASILQTSQPGLRNGANERLRAIFSAYIMCGNPSVSSLQAEKSQASSFGQIAKDPMIPAPKRTVLSSLSNAGSKSAGDVGMIVPTSARNLDLLPKRNTGVNKSRKQKEPKLNPNKLIYEDKISRQCYLHGGNNKKKDAARGKTGGGRGTSGPSDVDMNDDSSSVPTRYRLTLRPANVVSSCFDPSESNKTGMYAGWDYPPSSLASHVPCVLVLLYFMPEVRHAMLEKQFDKRLFSSKTVDHVPTLSTELGFLFQHMEAISHNAMTYPGEDTKPRVGVFVSTNFIQAFATLPEAVNQALLDDNPAVAAKARRPEAFHRFLLYHLDKEAGSKKNPKKPMDSLHGINFVSVNEFVSGSGKPSISSTRALLLDMNYDPFVRKGTDPTTKYRFGQLLRHSLCRETRLRAWNNATQAYETVLQRKIAVNLPEILSISCSCAGREDSIAIWRTCVDDVSLWLPELIEVEMEDNVNIVVREQVDSGESNKKWISFKGDTSFPASITDLITIPKKAKHRYRLEAVVSFINDPSKPEEGAAGAGHHVLHVRVPPDYRKRSVTKQREHAEQLYKLLSSKQDKMTLTSKTPQSVVKKRIEHLTESLKAATSSEWILFNGYVVTPTSVEDARAFHVDFKEPCIVMYRTVQSTKKSKQDDDDDSKHVLGQVMFSRSMSTNKTFKNAVSNVDELPKRGDLVAIDAEFVSVQEEEAVLTDTGAKMVLRETRHALARISAVDCRSGRIIIDDYVLPREPVVDHLTRFSGIVASDLDARSSPHHLVSARTAHLKLRYLLEQGCIFLGHGLSRDFDVLNLFVPPCQIIDTVEIYHQHRMRYISLRFLTNYVLNRDMQVQVHDSVEDAKAAWELYIKAKELTDSESMNQFLNDLYAYGKKTDWRLGVDDD